MAGPPARAAARAARRRKGPTAVPLADGAGCGAVGGQVAEGLAAAASRGPRGAARGPCGARRGAALLLDARSVRFAPAAGLSLSKSIY